MRDEKDREGLFDCSDSPARERRANRISTLKRTEILIQSATLRERCA
jgi:hypothetical protein